MIIDTDASYELMGKQFTSLPIALDGIKSDLGIFGYLLGRFGNIIRTNTIWEFQDRKAG